MTKTLLKTLQQAEVVCKDCGLAYGKYSVGCSSSWMGNCHVCGKYKSVTESRDYGYLQDGLRRLAMAASKVPPSETPVTEPDEPSYTQGDIACCFEEKEVEILCDLLDQAGAGKFELDSDYKDAFLTVRQKVTELYEDHCVKYELSPAMKAYNAKYGTWGSGSLEEEKRWEGFRDAYVLLAQEK